MFRWRYVGGGAYGSNNLIQLNAMLVAVACVPLSVRQARCEVMMSLLTDFKHWQILGEGSVTNKSMYLTGR